IDGFPYFANFEVWHYGGGHAEFYACTYRWRWCESAGTVEVENGTQLVTLESQSDASAIWYDSFVDTIRVDEPFHFTWSSTSDHARITGDAPLPDELAISAPADLSTVSAASPLTIDWTGPSVSGDDMAAWGYRATCPDSPDPIESFSHLVPDSGHLEIPAEQN